MAIAPRIDLDRLLMPPMDDGWFEQSWWDETYRSSLCRDDELTAKCAMLAEGLEHMERRREKDRHFPEKYDEWRCIVSVDDLEPLIEQSTDEAGQLLLYELRMMRTYTAPSEWSMPMQVLMKEAPKHVLAHLLLWVSMEVRVGRARRTGTAHWKPHGVEPPEPEPAFRASKFKPRPYGR